MLVSNHVVILNFSREKVMSILQELALASVLRENSQVRTVVVLSQDDKQELEETIYNDHKVTKRLDVIVRSGSPFATASLRLVGAERAGAIILLKAFQDAEGDSACESDDEIIKSLLALRKIWSPVRVCLCICPPLV